MTEERLSNDELYDRCWAVFALAVEGRDDDVDELLVTLPWEDVITVVCGLGSMAAGAMGRGTGLDEVAARARVAGMARAMLMERLAARERPADGG
ncbi:hypothetical protein OHA02_17310 [Streptomyces phaeochromogenes]|nr:hypothetical protein [Streptomyces phaeochromogenes]